MVEVIGNRKLRLLFTWMVVFNWPPLLVWLASVFPSDSWITIALMIIGFIPFVFWINIPLWITGLGELAGPPHFKFEEMGALPQTVIAWSAIAGFWVALAILGAVVTIRLKSRRSKTRSM